MRVPHSLLFVIACAFAATSGAQAQTYSVLHSFQYFPHGASPYAPLYRDSSGNLYGTTNGGGPYNAGVVFEIDSAGNETVMHMFTGGTDGGHPTAGLVADSAGNLYGTAYQGGIAGTGVGKLGAGVVYKIDTSGRFQVLYSFTGGADGSGPFAGVILDAEGYLYGTTYDGGAQPNSLGVVYKLSASGQETVIYTFQGENGLGGVDGAHPYAGVTADRAGNLYGTTESGGADGSDGVVYKLSPSGQETLLFSFGSNGVGIPSGGGVILDAAGNIYGAGGVVVFKLDPKGNFTKLADLYSGVFPSGLKRDASGNLYFATQHYPSGRWPNGAVLKLDTGGKVSVLYKFEGAMISSGMALPVPNLGSGLNASVILDSAGNIYGSSPLAGTAGIVYKIDAGGGVTWLHNFVPAGGGTWPRTGLTLDPAGGFYGTALWGGGSGDDGVVFKLNPAGHETVLHTFKGGATDGARPSTGVVLDQAGNLYGSTGLGGPNNAGIIYKLTPSGQEIIRFNSGAGSLAIDPAGNLYGTAASTTYPQGLVFELDTAGNYTILHGFTGGADGGSPLNGLALDSAGNLYGTAYYGGIGNPGAGVVFKIDTSGAFSVLHAFLASSDGGFPYAGVILDAAGNIYGTCSGDGPQGGGTVYKINAENDYSVVYAFGQGLAGYGNPTAGVAIDPAGNLYGTLPAGSFGPGGPPGSYGQVYEIDVSGNATQLYSFTGGADGADPISAVTLDGAGHLYGIASGLFFTPVGGGTAFNITLR